MLKNFVFQNRHSTFAESCGDAGAVKRDRLRGTKKYICSQKPIGLVPTGVQILISAYYYL